MEYKPGGARFFADVNRKSIVKIELQDPCSKDLKIFDIISIEVNPVKVPHEYWPYPNCLFVSFLLMTILYHIIPRPLLWGTCRI